MALPVKLCHELRCRIFDKIDWLTESLKLDILDYLLIMLVDFGELLFDSVSIVFISFKFYLIVKYKSKDVSNFVEKVYSYNNNWPKQFSGHKNELVGLSHP